MAFSCQIRGICPSCNTRRMVETGAYLTDHVLPKVPHRQWVLSVPKRVRYLFRTERDAVGAVLRIFMRALETTLRRKSPGAPAASRFGAVAFVHHFGSSLNEHIHFHCIVTDGIFSEGSDGEAPFHEATCLAEADIEAVGEKTRHRSLGWLARHGYLDRDAAEIMRRWPHSGGFSVDGSVRLPAWDRGGLERLVRYCTRPAFSAERPAGRGIRAPGPVGRGYLGVPPETTARLRRDIPGSLSPGTPLPPGRPWCRRPGGMGSVTTGCSERMRSYATG